MAHNLIVRGFDDQVHEKLGEIANQRGVSINSIVKDAVDVWLKKQQSEVPRKHHLVIYSDDESMMRLLKSMDKLAMEGNLFRCFFGPPRNPSIELLSKLKWYDGTVKPYPFSFATQSKDEQHGLSVKQQQQQILPETTIGNFTLNIDVLGVNSETRNSTISIVGPEGETLTSNITIDLFSKAQQDFASESNPVALTIPININSSLLHDGDELKACLTMVDTSKVDCELTVITQYNLEGFPKSVQLEAGGNIEQQIRDLPK